MVAASAHRRRPDEREGARALETFSRCVPRRAPPIGARPQGRASFHRGAAVLADGGVRGPHPRVGFASHAYSVAAPAGADVDGVGGDGTALLTPLRQTPRLCDRFPQHPATTKLAPTALAPRTPGTADCAAPAPRSTPSCAHR